MNVVNECALYVLYVVNDLISNWYLSICNSYHFDFILFELCKPTKRMRVVQMPYDVSTGGTIHYFFSLV